MSQDLQQRVAAALKAAGPTGIDSYALGEAIKLNVSSTLTHMVKAGLAWTYEPASRQKQKRWFGTEAFMLAHQEAHKLQAHPFRKRKPGRPSWVIMHWAPDAVVVGMDSVEVQRGVGVQLGLRTNTHRNGL